MRILHTSDWHLGARLCDRDRLEEQKDFLNWLISIMKKEKIDVLIVAGDIFDTSNPPNSAETLYFDFLCSLKECDVTKTIIIGGNHDSISKLNSSRALLKQLSVEVIGGAEESIDNVIIPVSKDSTGQAEALICAVPFLREKDVRKPVPGETWEEKVRSIGKGIKNYYDKIAQHIKENYKSEFIPVIATGHLFAAGCKPGEDQVDLYVGNLGAFDASLFSEDYDYVALGHIHKNQKVGGSENIRYCGSPIPMEFGEDSKKSVIIVEFEQKKIKTTTIAVPCFRQLVRFRGTVEQILTQMENFKNPEIPLWADAEVEKGAAAGDVNLILNEKAAVSGIELLRIRNKRTQSENIINNSERIEIKDLDPVEVFFEKCSSAGISDEEKEELLPLYREILNEINQERPFHED